MPNDCVSFLINYENGDLTHDEVLDGFQMLLDSGVIRNLQGSYQRMAWRLLENGEIYL